MPKTAGEAGRRVGGKDASHHILQRCVSAGGGDGGRGPRLPAAPPIKNAAKKSFKCKFHPLWHRGICKISPHLSTPSSSLRSKEFFCHEADDVFTAAHRRHTVSDGRGPQADSGPAGRCGKTGEAILSFCACTGALGAQSNQSGQLLRVKRGFIVAGCELIVAHKTRWRAFFKLVLVCVFFITS